MFLAETAPCLRIWLTTVDTLVEAVNVYLGIDHRRLWWNAVDVYLEITAGLSVAR
jgi:hypothetical protein